VTLADLIRMAWRHGIDLGMNKDGQLIADMIDPTEASVRSVTILDTLKQSFRQRRNRQEIRTAVRYRYAPRYIAPLKNITPAEGEPLPVSDVLNPEDAGPWTVEDTTITHPEGEAKYGTRTLDLDLDMTRDADTAADIADLHRDVRGPGPVEVALAEGICGTNVDLVNNHDATHFELPPSADTNILLRNEQHELDLDTFAVRLTSLNVEDIGSP
jgi:hypothetical protein